MKTLQNKGIDGKINTQVKIAGEKTQIVEWIVSLSLNEIGKAERIILSIKKYKYHE